MLVFKGATLFPIESAPFVGDLAVENGKIAALGPSLSIPGAQVVPMEGRYILPGLVDAHSHIGLQQTGTREVDHNEKGDPITPQMRAIDAIHPQDAAFADCRRLGITTVVTGPGSINLLGGSFAAVKPVGETADQMLLRDNIAMKMALGESPIFRYTELGKNPRTRMGAAALIRQALTDAKSYLARKTAGQIDRPNLAMEALFPVLAGRMPMKIHCHRADDIATAIRIMDEFGLRYTLDHCTEGYLVADTLHRALESGRCEGIIIGPLLCFFRKLECRNKQGCEYGSELYRLKLPFAICTDFPDTTLECLLLQAARSVAYGLPEQEALAAITLQPAKILGLADRVGSLAVGKDADLAIFTGHPFDYKSLCCETYIDGRKVWQLR